MNSLEECSAMNCQVFSTKAACVLYFFFPLFFFSFCVQVLGTPNEDTWPGVHSLPHFKPGRSKYQVHPHFPFPGTTGHNYISDHSLGAGLWRHPLVFLAALNLLKNLYSVFLNDLCSAECSAETMMCFFSLLTSYCAQGVVWLFG